MSTSTTDPVATMVSGISFSALATDITTIGSALVTLYLAYVGVKWVLRMVRHA